MSSNIFHDTGTAAGETKCHSSHSVVERASTETLRADPVARAFEFVEVEIRVGLLIVNLFVSLSDSLQEVLPRFLSSVHAKAVVVVVVVVVEVVFS